MKSFFLLAFSPFLLSAITAHGLATNQLKVQTSSGKIAGIIEEAQPNVRQFLGIPYAQSPLNELRWEPPRALPKNASTTTIEATKLPPSCQQFLSRTGTSIYIDSVLQFNLQGLNTTGAVSEDCLTLSVWTPTLSFKSSAHSHSKLLPVLIFIYGGAFQGGGQDVSYQLPPQWVQRTQDHIVVSFNYRLNIFGFPNALGLTTQNLGLLDQRLAVQWIQQNIRAFGGDPERMVLWGQSAGSMSVDFYSYAYPTDPIVKGLIMDSGTSYLPIRSYDYSGSNFSFVATKLGCTTTDPTEQLSWMRSLPASKLEGFVQQYSENGTSPGLNFNPIPDNKTIFTNYTSRGLAGQQSHLPAIIGSNANEGVAFVSYPIADPAAGVNTTAATLATLNVIFCPATETISVRQATGRPTYRYLYAGNFSNISPLPWEGAYHSAELPMLFGTFDNFRGQGSELESATSEAMQDAWVAFARDGTKGLEGTGWMPYELGGGNAREFGAGVAVGDASIADTEAMCEGPFAASS